MCTVPRSHSGCRDFFSTTRSRRPQMNRDQVKGRAREVAGKIEKNAGPAAGSAKTEAKGLAREAVGKVQKNLGDARNSPNNTPQSASQQFPRTRGAAFAPLRLCAAG